MSQGQTKPDSMDLIALGRVIRAHGVHGAAVILPYNEANPDGILNSRNLYFVPPALSGLAPQKIDSFKGKVSNQGLIIKFKHITTREAAAELKGWEVAIPRGAMEEAGEDEYYLADLKGLSVVTAEGRLLGRVENFLEAGAGLILVVKGSGPETPEESLVPFRDEFLVEVDLTAGKIVVDLPPGLLDD